MYGVNKLTHTCIVDIWYGMLLVTTEHVLRLCLSLKIGSVRLNLVNFCMFSSPNGFCTIKLSVLSDLPYEHLYSPLLAENQETNKQENKQIDTDSRKDLTNLHNNLTTYHIAAFEHCANYTTHVI